MPDSDALKEVQRIEYENLKKIIEICESGGLRYYLLGGTLLGALRHQGFIPWDDDADIGIPRPDYSRFVKLAMEKMPKHMHLRDTGDYIQLVNNKIKFYYDAGQRKEKVELWTDIFPIDGLPSSKVSREFFWLNMRFHRALYKFTKIDLVRTNVKRPFYETALIKFAKITHIGKLLSPYKMRKKYENVISKYNYDTSKYVGNLYGVYGKREIVPKYQLSGDRTAKFEGLDVHIPEGAEDYLTSIYGDWRKLPPPEQRKGHPIEFAD